MLGTTGLGRLSLATVRTLLRPVCEALGLLPGGLDDGGHGLSVEKEEKVEGYILPKESKDIVTRAHGSDSCFSITNGSLVFFRLLHFLTDNPRKSNPGDRFTTPSKRVRL